MRLLVTGGTGLLGSEIVAAGQARGWRVTAPSHTELDLTRDISPDLLTGFDWCINSAAYTAVDRSESEEAIAAEINADGPARLADACHQAGTRLLHVSTDFVFDGKANQPYLESSEPNPLGAYGRTKRAGEIAVLNFPNHAVARVAWLFGPSGGPCFPLAILRAWKAGKALRVVDDQVGTPTYTPDLAERLLTWIEAKPAGGLAHFPGPVSMSWYEFARRLLKQAGPDAEVTPISTAEWPTPAPRPAYSVLASERADVAALPPMPRLDDAIERFLARILPGLAV